MRWLLRMLLTWAVLLPLGYYVGLPYAATYLQTKTRAQTMAQCQQQLLGRRLAGEAGSAITAADGDRYCHCLADPLTFTREDIIGMAKHYGETGQRQAPERLTVLLKSRVETCNDQLQQAIIAKTRARQPSSREDERAGGTYIIK